MTENIHFRRNSYFVNTDVRFDSIDKFFVEVVDNAEHNTITEVRSFKYGHSLDKYSGKF